jgi:hypothetical protein
MQGLATAPLTVLFLCSAAMPFFSPMATFPTIHLNGTGFTDLRDGYAVAYDAIDKAMEALGKAELNGRDCYVQGPAAYSQARAERDAAFAKLRAAHEYVGEMLIGICNQQR